MASAQKRGNSYILRTSLGYNNKDEQIQKFRTWKPEPGMSEKQIQKELERQLFLFEEQCRTGRILDSSTKFQAFSEYWLTEYAEKQLRASTVAGYKHMLERINTAIGHIKLDKLQPQQLMELYINLGEGGIKKDKKKIPLIDFKNLLNEHKLTHAALAGKAHVSVKVIDSLTAGKHITEKSAGAVAVALDEPVDKLFKTVNSEQNPLSAKTILHHHRLISSILEKAVKWQIIFSNPCDRTEIPKVERKEARYLDEKQAAELLACLDSEPLQYRAMITLLLYSGMRRGELCGLEWTDVDFDNCIIDINKSSLYLTGKGVFTDETKNFTSKRVIKLPLAVMDLLHIHKAAQGVERFRHGDAWQESGKLFTQCNGKPIHPDSVTSWFHDFIERNNLPDACLHSLRHTNATLLIASGTDLRTVSKRLGHAQLSTTGNIYTHAIQTADERAADTLNDMLKPSASKQKKA